MSEPVRLRPGRVACVALALLLSGIASCHSIIGCVTSDTAEWGQIQSVGGIAIHEPIRQTDGTYLLPVDCNISGLEAITCQPTTMNSGLVIRATDAEIHGRVIELRIVTCLVNDNDRNCRAPPAQLGRLAPGHYEVRYGDSGEPAAELGTITIGD